MIKSHNEWDTLKEVFVGVVDGAHKKSLLQSQHPKYPMLPPVLNESSRSMNENFRSERGNALDITTWQMHSRPTQNGTICSNVVLSRAWPDTK